MFPEWERAVVLVVEDDPNSLAGFVEFLTEAGFAAVGRSDGTSALAFARETTPDIVIDRHRNARDGWIRARVGASR